jgi:transposase
VLPAADRLDEIIGTGRDAAQAIIAEIGLHMSALPTAAHLLWWAKISLAPSSQAPAAAGHTGKGNPYLKGVLGEAAAAAGKTDAFLSER